MAAATAAKPSECRFSGGEGGRGAIANCYPFGSSADPLFKNLSASDIHWYRKAANKKLVPIDYEIFVYIFSIGFITGADLLYFSLLESIGICIIPFIAFLFFSNIPTRWCLQGCRV